MDLPEKACDICGKSYKLKPHHFSSVFAPIMDSSHVRIKLESAKTTELYDYDICPVCATKVLRKVIELQRERPMKCDFCEFDKAPSFDGKVPEQCEACYDYDKFQLKKRMCERQHYEWLQYKRYFGEVDE